MPWRGAHRPPASADLHLVRIPILPICSSILFHHQSWMESLSCHLVGYDGFSNSIKDVPQTGVLLPLHYSEMPS